MARGQRLEKKVRELFVRYKAMGIHCQQNFPRRLATGTFVGKHGFDFQVLHNGVFYAFDAKECSGDKWRPDKRQLHQEQALFVVDQCGGQAFFLVWFEKYAKLCNVPVPCLEPWYKPNGRNELRTIDFLGVLPPKKK